MKDIRLKKITKELDGKPFELCCNFNVLADIQEEYGSLPAALGSKAALKFAASVLAYMMNDYADTMGWEERYTPRQAGRFISPVASDMGAQVSEITNLVLASIMPLDDEKAEETEEKNG
jgi:hypothetical protein